MLPILNQSFWRDEAFSALLSEKSPLEIIRLTSHDVSPPLYYIILHYWMILFGNNEVSIRSLSLLFHLLTVCAVFFVSRKLIRSLWGQLLITSTALLNPFLIQYAFEARPYSLLAFLTILAVYAISIKKYILASIVLGIAILTHNFAVFTFIAIVCWWLMVNRANIPLKKSLNLITVPILSLLIWGGVMWSQWIKVAQGFWITQSTSSIFLHTLETYSKGDLSYSIQPLFYMVSLIVLFFAFSYWVWYDRKEENSSILLIFLAGIIPVFITYFISALFAPIYHERYLIATDPLFILLAGYSLYRLYEYNTRIRTILIAFIAIYVALLIQGSEQIIGSSTKPAINYSVNQILARASDNDVIIPKDFLNFLETKYYVERSGRKIKTYAYSSTGKIPFYIGTIVFEPQDIVSSYPKNKKIWEVEPDGGFSLLKIPLAK